MKVKEKAGGQGRQRLHVLVLESRLFLDEKKFEETTLCAKLKKSKKIKWVTGLILFSLL